MKDFDSKTDESLALEAYSIDRTSISRPFSIPNQTFYAAFGKRALDICVVAFSAAVTLPIIVLCAVFIALDGHWPFYGQMRVGKDGREFRCWKVRSMVTNAEAFLAAHLAADDAARAEWADSRKLKNDPRITRFGRFLRKSSLDELPQILNVLMGEMSIVGPRPVVRDELELYGFNRSAYLSMRPGITGLWQVSGRNDVSYDNRVGFDREYSVSYSLLRDLTIILKTIRVVLLRNGH